MDRNATLRSKRANPGSESEFLLEFFSPSGEPLPLEFEDGASLDSLRMPLPAGASRTFSTSGSGPLAVGYARLKSTVSMGAVEVFARSDASGVVLYKAGVPASRQNSEFALLVDSLGDRDTGVALLNPPCAQGDDRGPAVLQMRLYDADSQLVATGEAVLPPGTQRAQFVREFFPDQQAETLEMRGLLSVVSNRPVVALSLRQNHPGGRLPDSVPTLFALPVLPAVESQSGTESALR